MTMLFVSLYYNRFTFYILVSTFYIFEYLFEKYSLINISKKSYYLETIMMATPIKIYIYIYILKKHAKLCVLLLSPLGGNSGNTTDR